MKVKILTQAADTLWAHDEPRARKLFADAVNVLDALRPDEGRSQRARGPATSATTDLSDRIRDLRSDALQRLARRDFKLAEELREAIKEAEPAGRDEAPTGEGEKAELARDLAVAVAQTNPDQTARFVRTELRGGITPPLTDSLIRIRYENPQLADQLFGEAVAAARANLRAPGALECLAEYVLPHEHASQGRRPAADPARAVATRGFLVYAADRLAAQAAAGDAAPAVGRRAQREYRTLHALLPLFESHMPDKAAAVRDRMGALTAGPAPPQADATSAARPDQVEDLLRQAEAATGARPRDVGFMRASQAASRQGDLERAISIAGKIGDPEERGLQVSLLTYQAALRKLENGDAGEAHRLARRVEFLPQRVVIFNLLAGKLRDGKEQERARAVIEEIWEWADRAENTPPKVKALLTLAATMADYDVERSFEFLRSAATALDRTTFPHPAAEDRPSRVLPVTMDMLDFDTIFSRLARLDFERASQAAQSFNTREASLLAQVIVCRQALAPSGVPEQ